jgi:alkylation response protein AidB-like acyl-CoA dehydrogenase
MASELGERAEQVAELIRSRADEIEEGRRITDDVLEAIRGTGLNRSLVPRDLGGTETPLVEVIDALTRLAAADGSAGWCAAVGAGTNLLGGYIDPDAAKELFADPDASGAGQFGSTGQVRPVDGGGLSLNGRWAFASNCLHAETTAAGAFFFDAAGDMEPIPRLVLVPTRDLEVIDTWDAGGLRGTGSHDTVATDVAVDRGRSVSFVDRPWAEGTLWRLPPFSVLGPVLGCTVLGMATGALDEVGRLIREGAGAARGALVDDPVGMADYAAASARLDAAKAGLDAACARLWDGAERGERPGADAQAALMMAINHGAEAAVDVTSTAHRLGGGAAAYLRSPLVRKLRDVQTARQHIMFGFSHRPMLGRALAGLEVFAPPFIT